MSIAKLSGSNLLPAFMGEAIKREIERATEEELEAAKKRIDERKSQIIAGVVLYVERLIKVQTIGENLVITIKLKD